MPGRRIKRVYIADIALEDESRLKAALASPPPQTKRQSPVPISASVAQHAAHKQVVS